MQSNNVTNKVSSSEFVIKNSNPKIFTATRNKFEALVDPPEMECMALEVAPSPSLDGHVATTKEDQLNYMHHNNPLPSSNNNLISPTNTPKMISKDLQNSSAYLISSVNEITSCMNNKILDQHLSQENYTAPQMANEDKHVPGEKSIQNPIKTTSSSNPEDMQIEVTIEKLPRSSK